MFNPVDYFYVANDLYWNAKKVDCSEACYRASASRAYYSVFLLLREKLGIQDRDKVHEKVKDAALKNKPRVGNLFKDFHSCFRAKADYEIKDSFTQSNAQKSMQKAQAILQELGHDVEFKPT
jgi:uncharacterized protein (UPF0332 family)